MCTPGMLTVACWVTNAWVILCQEADEDLLREWKELGATGNARHATAYTKEQDRSRPHVSLLLMRGQMAVHGLFDFLLQAWGASSAAPRALGATAAMASSGAVDVPLLLARTPFLNASLKSLKVRLNGPLHRARSSTLGTGLGGRGGASGSLQVLELVGHALPSAIREMASAMARACIFATRVHQPLASASAEALPSGGGAVGHPARSLTPPPGTTAGDCEGDGCGPPKNGPREGRAGRGGYGPTAHSTSSTPGTAGRDLFRMVWTTDPDSEYLGVGGLLTSEGGSGGWGAGTRDG
ncbi:unnamed protein product, partial [Discosporangium mesarthrocarpum]